MYRQAIKLLGSDTTGTIGLQTRFDRAHVRLGTQRTRDALAITQESRIFQASYSPYLKLETQLLPWLRFSGGGRVDLFTFDVNDRCGSSCSIRPEGDASDVIGSLKGNLIFGPWEKTELFLNVGTGFHSNDARDVVANSSATTLPRAVGYEIGVRSKAIDWGELLFSLWLVDLESV